MRATEREPGQRERCGGGSYIKFTSACSRRSRMYERLPRTGLDLSRARVETVTEMAVVGAAAVGIEWVVDAAGCDAAALRDAARLDALFAAILDTARLTPVAPATWHRFPHTGGLTGVQVLAESHLTCHTFPEHASLCLNVFCCVTRPDWDLEGLVRRSVGAREIGIRRIERRYGAHPIGDVAAASVAQS
jgi:S-adenosylmethionine decarboxylase